MLRMSIEVLNTELVREKIKERGWTLKWVIAQLDLGQDGYKLLRGEWMPKDNVRKTKVLRTLAKLLGMEVPQILLRLEATRAS